METISRPISCSLTIAAPDQRKRRLLNYRYQKLPNQYSFRYLELLPGSKDDEVAYKLRLGNMRNPPAYEAISYAWGNPNIKVPSVCDGSLLEITPSLWEGLRHLRSERETRLLWADAVCIDQQNSREKNRQVMNMKKIYESATRVVVWLGLDELCEDGKSTKARVAADTPDEMTHALLDHWNLLEPTKRGELWMRPINLPALAYPSILHAILL